VKVGVDVGVKVGAVIELNARKGKSKGWSEARSESDKELSPIVRIRDDTSIPYRTALHHGNDSSSRPSPSPTSILISARGLGPSLTARFRFARSTFNL
jgi:hypothetical protein